MIWSVMGFVILPALLCASACSWWVNDVFVMQNVPDVMRNIVFLIFLSEFSCVWAIIYVMFSTKSIKENVPKLGVIISALVFMASGFKALENPNLCPLVILSFLSIFVWWAIEARCHKKEEEEEKE